MRQILLHGAQTHRERVSALVLGLVTTTSRREVEWITQDVGCIFPREWEQFTSAVPDELRQMRPVDAYAMLLTDPDPAVHEPAAGEWCRWEDSHVSLAPDFEPNPRYEDPEFRLRFARLVTHFFGHHGFLPPDGISGRLDRIVDIPAVLVRGRLDIASPLGVVWRLAQSLPHATLHVVEDEGHGGSDVTDELLVRALESFASSPAE